MVIDHSEKPEQDSRTIRRLQMGEAYMMCRECGARLYSFDGDVDQSRSCPYEKGPKGECTDKLKYSSDHKYWGL